MSGEFFPGNNEPVNNEPKPMAPENMVPADTPEAPASETPTEFVIPEAAAAEIGATAIDAAVETEPVIEPVEADIKTTNEFTNFTGEQEAAPVNREELENSVVEKVEKDPKKKKILVGVGVAILALSVGVGGIIAGINGKKNHGDNKPTEPTRNTIETTETGDITTTETDAPVVTITEETPASETTETPTETTETPTETAETEQSGEVNPDDFWDTAEDGTPLFHVDEYAEALGYDFFSSSNPCLCAISDYLGGDNYIYYDTGLNEFEYRGTVYNTDSNDYSNSDMVFIEYNNHVGHCAIDNINDTIFALQEFSNPNSDWHTTFEAPNGWTAREK